jgi:hypothetical protein
MLKLAPRGHVVIKMNGFYNHNNDPNKVLTAADFGFVSPDDLVNINVENNNVNNTVNLFVDDSNVPCFFRLFLIFY